MNDIFMSVVIPTYNESKRLPPTLREVLPYLRRTFARYEVVIVDDASPDRTLDTVRELFPDEPNLALISQNGRLGKGAAVRRGCAAARGDLVLFMDADHSTRIECLGQLIAALPDQPDALVAGVRTYQDDEDKWRRVVGILGQLAAHLIVLEKAVVDTQCGFKLFTRAAVQKIIPLCRVDGGMLDVELFHLAQKLGVACRFVPVHWKNDPNSKINIPLCIVRDPLALLKIRLSEWRGLYEPGKKR